jgi:hypothetical protein
VTDADFLPDAKDSQCSPFDPAQVIAFSQDLRNGLVIESGCAPVGFSGIGRVRRVRKSGSQVDLVDIALDAPGVCDPEIPPGLMILVPRVDWGLEVDSELRIDLFGNNDPFELARQGAIIYRPDGSLLAAAFNQSEEFLRPFLEHLPAKLDFAPDCQDVAFQSQGKVCYRSVTQRAMVIQGRDILRENHSATLNVSGASFHLALSFARDHRDPTGLCDFSRNLPSLGPSYRFFMMRMP